MPSYTRGISRKNIAFVQIKGNFPIFYGFNQKDFASVEGVTEGDLALLGHKSAAEVGDNVLKMLRATRPKPARVRKVINRNPGVNQQASVSTFCAEASYNAALSDGWKIVSQPKSASLTNNARTVTALAELDSGGFYAFPMNKADFDSYGKQLGLESPATFNANTDAERFSVMTGSSMPRPGKATKQAGNGTITSYFSTSAESNVRSNGWSIINTEFYF